MGGDALKTGDWDDDWEAWRFLESVGYTQHKGVIAFRPERVGHMSPEEGAAIDYLFDEWDWGYR